MINWLANPVRFLKFARIATPIFGWLALLCLILGAYFGLFKSPAEQYQGESVRIMYVHFPSVALAMLAYLIIAVASFISYVWRHPLADIGARACALPGAAFTFLGLVTGSLWGSVTWMTYWVWDARLTSFLVLLFIYIGYMSVWTIIKDKKLAARIAGLVAMVGIINIPIIKFSVDWWSDDVLHQKATFSTLDGPGLGWEFGLPLTLMFVGFTALFAWVVLRSVTHEIYKIRNQPKPERSAASVKVEVL